MGRDGIYNLRGCPDRDSSLTVNNHKNFIIKNCPAYSLQFIVSRRKLEELKEQGKDN